MKSKEKFKYLDSHLADLSAIADGVIDMRVFGDGEDVPETPKRKETRAFLDGVSLTACMVRAFIMVDDPSKHMATDTLGMLLKHWVKKRGGHDE